MARVIIKKDSKPAGLVANDKLIIVVEGVEMQTIGVRLPWTVLFFQAVWDPKLGCNFLKSQSGSI